MTINTAKKIGSLVLLITLFLAPMASVFGVVPVYAGELEDRLQKLEQELESIKKEKRQLSSLIKNENSKISTYSGQVSSLQDSIRKLQADISELNMEIRELNTSISILETQIEIKEAEIEETLEGIETMEEETEERILSNYMNFRLHKKSGVDFFQVDSINAYFKDSQYHEIIQANANEILDDLADLYDELDIEKTDLEEKNIALLRDKEVLDEQKKQLSKKQSSLQADISAYNWAIANSQTRVAGIQNEKKAMSREQARKEAEAEKLRQQIFNRFSSIPNGKYVAKGTVIGRQGSTGLSTGPHVHFITKVNGVYKNPCRYVPGGKFGNCGGNGQLGWPLSGSFYYTSSYGYRCISGWGYCSYHRAIDIAHSIWNAPVYASHSGWLYKGKDSYGALYVIVCQYRNNCNKGFMTGYWHLSSH